MSRKKCSKELKVQVAKQVIEEGKKISHIVNELDLPRYIVYRWVNQYEAHGKEAFSGEGNARRDHFIQTLPNGYDTGLKDRTSLQKGKATYYYYS